MRNKIIRNKDDVEMQYTVYRFYAYLTNFASNCKEALQKLINIVLNEHCEVNEYIKNVF